MNPFHLFAVLLFLSCIAPANAQTHADCDDPMLLTDMNPVTIDSTFGEGNADDLLGTCLAQEFSSTWFSWQIEQPGTLTFVLTPQDSFQDLDFAVFRFNDNLLCQEKILKRCCAAGENVGAPASESAPCLGPTGLNLTETDIEEQPGCSNGNNNFLKFLQCQAGENYALVVNDFSSSGQGFTLEWGGTATFSSSPEGINSQTQGTSRSLFSIGPNPTKDVLYVHGLGNVGVVTYRITDSLGRFMRSGQLQTGNRSLNVSQLSNGVYFLTIYFNDIRHAFKFIIQ